MSDSYWGADVKVSMPIPPRFKRRVPMSGFAFTDGGLAHDIDDADYVRMSTPTYAPRNFGLTTVYEDADLDAEPNDIEVI